MVERAANLGISVLTCAEFMLSDSVIVTPVSSFWKIIYLAHNIVAHLDSSLSQRKLN